MRSKLRLTLAAGLMLAAATPALAGDHGSLTGYDEADYGDTPPASSWSATIRAPQQDDSKMQPPEAAPGTEKESGVTADVQYDETRMLPLAFESSRREASMSAPQGPASDAISEAEQVAAPAPMQAAKLTPFANDGVDKPAPQRRDKIVRSGPVAPRPLPNDGIDSP